MYRPINKENRTTHCRVTANGIYQGQSMSFFSVVFIDCPWYSYFLHVIKLFFRCFRNVKQPNS